ncbi:hypothetical protein F4782DRAFT_142847 [Xylaria castorea]|nr:hypothetical protein F4782DRAFT_142847 [Xylaria castorea]
MGGAYCPLSCFSCCVWLSWICIHSGNDSWGTLTRTGYIEIDHNVCCIIAGHYGIVSTRYQTQLISNTTPMASVIRQAVIDRLPQSRPYFSTPSPFTSGLFPKTCEAILMSIS